MSYTRRYLLVCLGYAGSIGAGPLLPGRMPPAGLPAAARLPDAAARLRRLVDDRVHARLLGGSYRAQYPAESDPEVLARLILDAVAPLDRSPQALRHELLLPALDGRVRAEFGSGTTVRVDGWILAITEARLCALCA
jgi:hypothetical protein